MCGIAGIVSTNKHINPELIVNMTDMINYRGPDGYGYLSCNLSNKEVKTFDSLTELDQDTTTNIFFGHRRLSIIDLSEAGKQPMSYANDKYWIIYNGEIYNYIEIKEELLKKGYKFKSTTDTEVILASYCEWGIDCLKKFNGMWSFAILDIVKNTIFCARDRFGIKPFYYNFSNGIFSFGSEIKQLNNLPWIKKEVNIGELFDFIAFNRYGCNSENTLFDNIFDLRGGHYLIIDLNCNISSEIKPVMWWDINLSEKSFFNNEEECFDKFYDLFNSAVSLRLRSDVEVGSCLSGGLDSSGIVCMIDNMNKKQNNNNLLKTFTSQSEHTEYDETMYANEVISKTQVKPYFMTPSPERLFKEIDNLVWHQDEPFLSTSIFASWCVYNLIGNNGIKVTLDGQGPDEILGGYLFAVYQYFLLDTFQHSGFNRFKQELFSIKQDLNLSYFDILKNILKIESHGRYPKFMIPSLSKAKNIFNKDIYYEGVKKSFVINNFVNSIDESKKKNTGVFNYTLYNSVKYDSLPGILRQADRNSMAFSVEARFPFLDHRLVEYVFSLPNKMKIRNGLTKFVYREALKNLLPEKIYNRKSKLGFETAEPYWMRNFTHILKNQINSNLSDFCNLGLINQSIDNFHNQKSNYNTIFWKYYSFSKWLDIFKMN